MLPEPRRQGKPLGSQQQARKRRSKRGASRAGCYPFRMARLPASAFTRRLLVASLLFVLFDIALFGWLIFRSLSQREIDSVLLETRGEAQTIARQIEGRAKRQGSDLYTAVA